MANDGLRVAVIEQELEEERKRIKASKDLEEMHFQAKLARVRTTGRASTMHTTANEADVELGPVRNG